MKIRSVVALALAALVFAPSDSDAFAPASSRAAVVVVATDGHTSTRFPTAVFVSEENNNNGEQPAAAIFDFSKISDAASRAMDELPNYDASQVQKNLQQGELGSRGELYFLAQGALAVCILAGGIPLVGVDPIRIIVAPLILATGAGIALLSIVDLGSDSLSPFPKPTEEGTLKTTGVYSQMRHPMYTSLLCLCLGLSLLTDSADRLILSGLLWYLLEVKTEKEESFLMEHFGSDYADYQVCM
jgi:protein-S-isoprenylcysteine O-methyltransferase Ste14